ncbi:MAG: hypothetical protein AUH42_06815 [Gemmatimonadetes bacterium 13_1_40CM_70_11]|nr:MAG: hypothetical protein AUH42_06815 [Gemmatimonadetes bacterium 13_1_40CM_70_11]
MVPLLLAAACGGDRSRTASCGLAQLAGPALIQQQLTIAPSVLTDPPRGLPDSMPARVVGVQVQGHVLVAYAGGRLALGYAGEAFPAGSVSDTTTYGLLVVDDSTQRAQGVLVYESHRPPKTYPQLGTLTGADRTIPLYGVRVDWAGVNNPRCPLLGAAAPSPPPPPPPPVR